MKFAPKWRPLRLTILTPVVPSTSDHLAACESSITELTYVLGYYGIIVQWLVAIDGPGKLAYEPQADEVVRLSQRKGIAKARNDLLSLATGDWIIPLDCDDEFDISGMASLGQYLIDCEEDLGWIAGNRLLITGEKTSDWNNTGRGYCLGHLATEWTSPFPFHPNSVAIRRTAIREVGGWPDVEVNEDMALMLLLNEYHAGRVRTDVLTRHRERPKPSANQPAYLHETCTEFSAIETLINTHRSLLGRTPVRAPIPGFSNSDLELNQAS